VQDLASGFARNDKGKKGYEIMTGPYSKPRGKIGYKLGKNHLGERAHYQPAKAGSTGGYTCSDKEGSNASGLIDE